MARAQPEVVRTQMRQQMLRTEHRPPLTQFKSKPCPDGAQVAHVDAMAHVGIAKATLVVDVSHVHTFARQRSRPLLAGRLAGCCIRFGGLSHICSGRGQLCL